MNTIIYTFYWYIFTEIGTKNENGFSIEECYEVNFT